MQQAAFKSEIQQLSNQQDLASKNLLLSPFLDQEGVFRVGGRLKNSMLTYIAKYQLVLPGNHKINCAVLSQEVSTLRNPRWQQCGRNSGCFQQGVSRARSYVIA